MSGPMFLPWESLSGGSLSKGVSVHRGLCPGGPLKKGGFKSEQVAFQSNANHPLAESMGYIKFEEM